MTVRVESADKAQVRRLISEQAHVSLSANEAQTLDTCLLFTYQLQAGFHDDKLVCVWGLIPPTVLSEQAYLWLYTTPDLEGREFLFVRYSQIAIEQMLRDYPRILGHCKVGADSSIRWLRWLGAEFFEPVAGLVPFAITRRAKHG